jgi:hypothetical protein
MTGAQGPDMTGAGTGLTGAQGTGMTRRPARGEPG